MGAREDLRVAMTILLVLDGMGVGLRIWVRTRVNRSFGYDDMATCTAFVGYIVLCGMGFAALGYGFADSSPQPHYDAARATMYLVACQLTYVIASGLAKASVALVLFRLTPNLLFRRILIISMAVVCVWTLVTLLTMALQCQPLSVRWNGSRGTCVEAGVIVRTGYSFSAMDIASNWLYALLPVAMLWDVRISLQMKVSVTFLLGLGVFDSIATIVRLKYLIQLGNPGDDQHQMAVVNLEALLWSNIELALAIFVGSLPALRPLLRYVTLLRPSNGQSDGGGEPRERLSSHELDPVRTIGTMPSRPPLRDVETGCQERILKEHPGGSLTTAA